MVLKMSILKDLVWGLVVIVGLGAVVLASYWLGGHHPYVSAILFGIIVVIFLGHEIRNIYGC